MNKNLLKTMGTCVALVVVFGLIMFGINFYTGPLIEENNKGALYGPAYNVMPDAEGFKIKEDLQNVPENFLTLFEETSGKGFVFRVNGTSQFSKEPFELSVAITTDGKIIKVNLDKTTETKPLTPGVLESFVGNDGTLSNVEITGGTTFTATAIKNAVEAGFKVLTDNNIIKEAVKTPEQILTELIPTVHTGMANAGVLKADAITNVSGSITSGYKAQNNSGFALIMTKGETKLLAVTNATGACKVYDLEGNDVTEANADLVTEALAYQTANGKSYVETATEKLTTMMEGATNFTEVETTAFNSVVCVLKFDVNGTVYYGINSKAFGYDVMNFYVVLDLEGKVVKVTATEVFIDPTGYIPAPDGLNSYGDKFIGMNGNEAVDGVEVIGSATLSSNAFKTATKDAFAAFTNMNGGNK